MVFAGRDFAASAQAEGRSVSVADRALSSPAKWQAATWPARPCATSGGAISEHTPGARAIGQRVWNRQPLGGFTGEGISPLSGIGSRLASRRGSGTGMGVGKALGYGGCGRAELATRCAVFA